ncbi:hypothetical protein C8R45DRAFT_1100395 [Mycena sanguinolenta]|nr:hypothetical protein C8R45DRAFT_1100395 [Mycena sanguinolenta]
MAANTIQFCSGDVARTRLFCDAMVTWQVAAGSMDPALLPSLTACSLSALVLVLLHIYGDPPDFFFWQSTISQVLGAIAVALLEPAQCVFPSEEGFTGAACCISLASCAYPDSMSLSIFKNQDALHLRLSNSFRFLGLTAFLSRNWLPPLVSPPISPPGPSQPPHYSSPSLRSLIISTVRYLMLNVSRTTCRSFPPTSLPLRLPASRPSAHNCILLFVIPSALSLPVLHYRADTQCVLDRGNLVLTAAPFE